MNTAVKRHPIRGFLYGIVFGLGLMLIVVGQGLAALGTWPPFIVFIVGIGVGTLWSMFGPAKGPKGSGSAQQQAVSISPIPTTPATPEPVAQVPAASQAIPEPVAQEPAASQATPAARETVAEPIPDPAPQAAPEPAAGGSTGIFGDMVAEPDAEDEPGPSSF